MSHSYHSGGQEGPKRNGGTQQDKGGGHHQGVPKGKKQPATSQAEGGPGSQGQPKYVKKVGGKLVSEYEAPQDYQPKQQQQPAMTVSQKFDSLLGGMGGAPQQLAQPIQPVKLQKEKPKKSQGKRLRYKKDQLVSKFKVMSEINFSVFEKDILNWIEIFSSTPQKPENIQATEPELPLTAIQAYPATKGRGQRYGEKDFHKKPYQKAVGSYRGADFRREMMGQQQDGEDEEGEEPEWIDFDPKKDTGSFFGRELPDASQMRDRAKKDKERVLSSWGKKEEFTEDQFEQLVQKERGEALKKAQVNKDLQTKAELLAKDLEQSDRKYSDIDLIYAKRAREQRAEGKDVLNEDQLENLFGSLREEEKRKVPPQMGVPEKKTAPKAKEEVKEKLPEIQNQQLKQQLQKEIQNLSLQQQQQLQAQKLVQQQRPRFSALQNIQNLFQGFPVVTHEKHRVKLEEIQKQKDDGPELFKQLMASINPFSKYFLDEIMLKAAGDQEFENIPHKPWVLEESLFQNKQHLNKTTAEMFKVYKYVSNPLIKVKSDYYTKGEYVEIKDLFPENNLLQTSPLNLQLQQYQQAMTGSMISPYVQAAQSPVSQPLPSQGLFPQTQVSPQLPVTQPNQSVQQQLTPQSIAPNLLDGNHQQLPLPKQEDMSARFLQQQQQMPPQYKRPNDLQNMESQLKSLLKFNPKQ